MATSTINLPFNILPGLTGYTGNISVLSCFPNWNLNTFDQNRALWSFGDGTYSTSPSATHVYNWPGVYTIELITYDINGTVYQNTFTQSISVQNIIPDLITISPNVITNIPAGRVSVPFQATRQNSWQSYPAVSAYGYTFNFYASGSLSNKLNLNSLSASKWAHIDRTWRFVVSATTPDGGIQYLPVDNTTTTNTELYYRTDPINQQIVPCGATDEGSIFVGTSGNAVFYYIDDTPKNYDSSVPPVFLYVSLDTTLFPDSYQVTTPQILQNTIYPELELFQHIKGSITSRIRYNAASKIIFTSCGLPELPISQNKWQNTEIPFFINFVDATGAVVVSYPSLTINTSNIPNNNLNVVNLQLLDSSNNPVSADFFATIDNQLPPAVSGNFRGYFIPYEAADNVSLNGYVTVYNPSNTQLDTGVGWVAYPDTDTVFKITSELTSFYTFTSAGLQINQSDSALNEFSIGKSGIFSIAVAPSASPDVNVVPYAWFGDADRDTLIQIDTFGNILNTVVLSTVLNTSSDEPLSPSYIALDSNNNIWVTLYDAAETIQLAANTGELLNVVTPATSNISFTAANVPYTFGGSNLIEPGIVDVDIGNDPWVCYTHPLCAFVEKYNGTTSQILSTFPLPQGISPTDMVIDQFSNVWVIAGFFTSINPGILTLVSPITAQKLPMVGNNFGHFQFTFNTSISSFLLSSYNYIFSVNGLSDPYYNGTHLIESVSGNSITVEPHPIAYEFASTISTSVSSFNPLLSASPGTLSSTFTFSDRLYKITPTGVITMIDGFYAPSYITIDTTQNIWVSHCLTRVSKIPLNSNHISTNLTVGSAQYVLAAVQETDGFIVADPFNNLIQMLVNNPHDRVFQHIEGITCDTFGNLWVINDFEGRMYYIPSSNPVISAATTTDFPLPLLNNSFNDVTRKTFQAIGDWNGMRWINKFPTVRTIQTLSGSSTFNILPQTGLYNIAKLNEDFDASSMYKSLRYTDRILNAQNLFDEFIGQAVGDKNADATTLGKVIYEKIANFPANNIDIDTCNVTALYSLCAELNIPIDNYQFLFPANLKRIFDLVSIKHSKLWGERSKFNRSFNNNFSQKTNYNLGTQIDTLTYIVSAGTNLVFNQLFNNEFKLITTMVLSAYIPGGATFTYPLSTYNSSWGWGLENGIVGTDIPKYYNVYEYIPTYDNTQEEGVIDWHNPLNNLVESASGIDVWLQDGGVVDVMLDYQLRKGLQMFD